VETESPLKNDQMMSLTGGFIEGIITDRNPGNFEMNVIGIILEYEDCFDQHNPLASH